MPVCIDCGGEVPVDARYCPFCGSPVELKQAAKEKILWSAPGWREKTGPGRAALIFLLMVFLLLLLFLYYVSRLVSNELSSITSGFY